MKIKIDSGLSSLKPKSYYRNVFNCHCITLVIKDDYNKLLLDKITLDSFPVEYKVNPGEGNTSSKKKITYNTYGIKKYQYWGTFKEVTKLPEIFDKLEEEDYTVHVSNFYRDKTLMPFIDYIIIHNIKKYEALRTKEKRKEKIFKINTL